MVTTSSESGQRWALVRESYVRYLDRPKQVTSKRIAESEWTPGVLKEILTHRLLKEIQ